ncbi:MAG: hypothetical protein IJ496_04620, partial [Ruminococcus sp.]|nr:hypothetical protein [Ruminococcus sp.]
MGLAILIVAAVWYFTYSLFPANKKGVNSSDASIAYDEICQYCGETQKINKVKIIKIGFFSLFIILFILMIILSIQRAAICFLFAAFLADPFGIVGKLDKYIEEKHRKRASIASICIFTLSGILTISSHYYYAMNPPTCKFSSFNDTLVEVSCLRETDDFIWNSIESEIDITNLEFVSENPEIALFEFDRVVFDDHIYYTIEPISNGETFVYVRCKECGAESNKIHVVVNGPKATETTMIQTTAAAITSTTTTT